ncbi:MAG: ZPR1 zinc finger domain-containing protein [Promethearchaeota archaeon]
MSEKAKESEERFSFKCPSCNQGLILINKVIYDIKDGDQMLILNFECDNCEFSTNDIIPLSTNMKPGIIILKIKNSEDLKSKIYRSPTGKLEIPELELVVDPGPRADFYFTNVEGILFRFESAVKIYKNNLEDNDPQVKEIEIILEDLNNAINGDLPFTLKITDLAGGSYIIPQEGTEYSFEPREHDDSGTEYDIQFS